ncbi:hypothetical protein ACJJIF_19225 [Microbulbifer sp. SSSA002]|uniref:hypothetical protein n=1 Tax=unclassified Microbulbifer TaxID=2619833 RepID=UPI00403903C6
MIQDLIHKNQQNQIQLISEHTQSERWLGFYANKCQLPTNQKINDVLFLKKEVSSRSAKTQNCQT